MSFFCRFARKLGGVSKLLCADFRPKSKTAGNFLVHMAEQIPEAEIQPTPEAEGTEVERQRHNLDTKLGRLKVFSEIGSLVLQALLLLDDIDDTCTETPELLQEMDLDNGKRDLESAIAFVRKLSNHARRALESGQAEVKDMLQSHYPATNLEPANLGGADGEQ